MTPALFALTYFGGIVASFLRWPLAVLGVYLLTFFAHPPSRWWGARLPDLRWAFVAAGAALVVAWMYKPVHGEKKPWYRDTIIVLIMCFVGWMWIQTMWAYGLEDHIKGVTFMTKYLLVMFVIVKLLDRPEAVDFMCVVHVLGCGYLGVLARESGIAGERLDGVGGPGIDDANTLGMMFATAAIIGGVQLLSGPKWKRALVALSLPFILNGLVLTQSRGAFLGLVVGGTALYVLSPQRNRRILRLLGGVGIVLFLAVASQNFWERMQTIKAEGEERDFSAQTRLVLAQAQLKMFADHPLGVGHRGTAALSREYLSSEYLANDAREEERARSSHNTFLSILVEQGVLGVVLYIALLFAVAKRILAMRSLREASPERSHVALLAAGVGGALAALFVSGQFADYLRAEVLAWLYAMTVALSRIAASMDARETSAVPAVADETNSLPLPHTVRIANRHKNAV